MPSPSHAFVAKWRRADLSERGAVQQHSPDQSAVMGHAPPAEHDPTDETFALEMDVNKSPAGLTMMCSRPTAGRRT